MDAHGHYVRSKLREAYENGGVYPKRGLAGRFSPRTFGTLPKSEPSACPVHRMVAGNVTAQVRARSEASLQNVVPGPVVHPRMRRKRSVESSTVTSSEPAHPRRFEKKTNT